MKLDRSLTMVALSLPLFAHGEAGKIIFEGKGGCLRCHSIEKRGGSLGPDLSDIGLKRSPESLRTSITDPNAEIYREYLTVVIATREGRRIEGIVLNEDDISVQLRDPEGNPRSFLKENIARMWREERSLMPSYATTLSATEIDSLVDYLGSLKGSPAQALLIRKPGPLTTSTAWLTRPNRDEQERPDMLLDSLRIVPGVTVVDLGAGAGYFTWRLSQRVGASGRVIAIDIQPAMLEKLRVQVTERKLTNVEIVAGTGTDPRLPESSVDLILIANAYHEFAQPRTMMAAVRRSLRPGGRLVVVEYAEESDDSPIAGLYTMTFRQLRSEMESMGFRLDRVLDFLPMQHGLIFTVPAN